MSLQIGGGNKATTTNQVGATIPMKANGFESLDFRFKKSCYNYINWKPIAFKLFDFLMQRFHNKAVARDYGQVTWSIGKFQGPCREGKFKRQNAEAEVLFTSLENISWKGPKFAFFEFGWGNLGTLSLFYCSLFCCSRGTPQSFGKKVMGGPSRKEVLVMEHALKKRILTCKPNSANSER